MWLHTWDAIVWNIWAKWRKMEFTALWDAVNLASRLEWVNKFYWTHICVSEDIQKEVKDFFIFRHLDKIRVKWKTVAVNIYELIWFKNKVDKFKLELIQEFEQALNLYFKWEFEQASVIFKKLSKLDKPSMVFYKRSKKLSIKLHSSDSRKSWNWIWEMENK